LRANPQAAVRFIGPGERIPEADVVILPGSKSVRADLEWLRRNGWEPFLARHLRYGGKVMGICGGLQMLGRRIHDPMGIEGEAGDSTGLGWLDLETTLTPEKQLRNVIGELYVSKTPVTGYEIHAGVSTGADLSRPLALLEGGHTDGAVSTDGQVLATYLHGIFERREACDVLLRWMGARDPRSVDYVGLREAAIERLADMAEADLDLKRLLEPLRLAM